MGCDPAHRLGADAPEGFIQKKNADTFFPYGKRLRINAIRFAGTPVLLIQQLDSPG